MLAYIGESSPECLLSPGQPLNIAARLPEDLTDAAEQSLTRLIEQQSEVEQEHCKVHRSDIKYEAYYFRILISFEVL